MTRQSSTWVRIHVSSLQTTVMQYLLLACFYNQPNFPGKSEGMCSTSERRQVGWSYAEGTFDPLAACWIPLTSPRQELRCLYPACAKAQDKATAASPLLAQPQAPMLLFKGSLRLKQFTALLKCMATRASYVHRFHLQVANHIEALLRKTLHSSQLPNFSHITPLQLLFHMHGSSSIP